MLTKHAHDAYYAVTNAARRARDLAWIREKLGEWNAAPGMGREGPVDMEVLDGWGLLAIQGALGPRWCGATFLNLVFFFHLGPKAGSYLQGLTSYDLQHLTFGTAAYVPIEGFNLHVARGGYTGEDGFEVMRFPCAASRRWLTGTP